MKTVRQITGSLIVGIAFVGGIISNVQAQITIQTPIVRADDYRTVLLRWNAETGAVYQVESADALEAEGPQGLQWVLREAECAAKGTTAEWLDVGDTRWIPRVLHPVFQPQRFYRVQKVGQATDAAPAVTIFLSQTNPVSGWLSVTGAISFANTNQQMSSIGIFVDGQRVHTGSAENFDVQINTTEWPNGTHEIYAVVGTVDGGETITEDDTASTNQVVQGIGVSTLVSADFENYISQFFVAVPYFDPSQGQTQEITAVFAEDSYWRVTVVDYQDTPVRWFEGQGTSCYAAWDGNDQSGFPLPFGYYDYIIEARPSQFGPLSLIGGGGEAAMMSAAFPDESDTELVGPAADYRRTGPAMQFSRTNSAIRENLVMPTLNPAKPVPVTPEAEQEEKLFPSSVEEALMAGLTSYYVKTPPMPPERILIDGVWETVPWEVVHGPRPPMEMKISEAMQEKFLQKLSGVLLDEGTQENGPQQANWPDDVYTTRTPLRFPGQLFMGYAGTVGIGFQGNHPGGNHFASPAGGVISLDTPPYGPLINSSVLANGFSINMGLGGWRTSFYLGNNNLRHTNILYASGRVGKFASSCDFGLIIGHMTAALNTSSYGATHSWLPLYNSDVSTATYTWCALPQFDLGQIGSPDTLKWMALYGCNSLRQQDFSDMWTKFLLPMPPNLRLLLGSETGVYIQPFFGWRFAANLHGWNSGGNPMTIRDAWNDASAVAHTEAGKARRPWLRPGTTVMSVVYRSTTQGGSWNTLNDKIWQWGTDISYDWFDISYASATVYTP
jgi:hypothetical protein